jgi:molybdopterin molybdotransferase
MIFETLVTPALLKMSGHTRVVRRPVKALLQEPVQKRPGKTRLLRVRLEIRDGRMLAFSAGDQNTGRLKTLVKADGIAVLSERDCYRAGDEVNVLPIAQAIDMEEIR